jgi:hypothetical protein
MKPNGSIWQGVNWDTFGLKINLFSPKDTDFTRFPKVLDADRSTGCVTNQPVDWRCLKQFDFRK